MMRTRKHRHQDTEKVSGVRVCPYKYEIGQEAYFKYETTVGSYYSRRDKIQVSYGTITKISISKNSKNDLIIEYTFKYEYEGQYKEVDVAEKNIYLTRESLIDSISDEKLCQLFNDSEVLQNE